MAGVYSLKFFSPKKICIFAVGKILHQRSVVHTYIRDTDLKGGWERGNMNLIDDDDDGFMPVNVCL